MSVWLATVRAVLDGGPCATPPLMLERWEAHWWAPRGKLDVVLEIEICGRRTAQV